MATNQLLALPIGDPSDTNQLAPQPTAADAYDYNTQALGDWIRQQRAQSVAMGYLDPNTGLPTQAGLVNAAHQFGNALLMGSVAPEMQGIRAFHGSPYDFDRFSSQNIGSGEGAQAFGHGLYFAGNENVARAYRDKLAPMGNRNAQSNTDAAGLAARTLQSTGSPEQAIAALTDRLNMAHVQRGIAAGDPDSLAFRDKIQGAIDLLSKPNGTMYEVNIAAHPDQLLDWDKPLSEQSEAVKQVMTGHDISPDVTGADAYRLLAEKYAQPPSTPNDPTGWGYVDGGPKAYDTQVHDPAAAATVLQQSGIPGIKYLDAGSRGEGQGTHNYVVFNDNLINILRKYGIAGLMGGGAATAAGTQDQQ